MGGKRLERSAGGGVNEPSIRSLSIDRSGIADPPAHPFSIPAVAALGELELHPRVTFLAGANASGNARIYELSERGIATVPYDSTETVELYRSLLAAPGEYHHHLRGDGA